MAWTLIRNPEKPLLIRFGDEHPRFVGWVNIRAHGKLIARIIPVAEPEMLRQCMPVELAISKSVEVIDEFKVSLHALFYVTAVIICRVPVLVRIVFIPG